MSAGLFSEIDPCDSLKRVAIFAAFLAVTTSCKSSPGFSPGTGPGLKPGQTPTAIPTGGANAGVGTGSESSSFENEGESVSYPLLSFTGQGRMNYSGKQYDLNQTISAQLSKTNLVINTMSFNSSKGEVDKEVRQKTGIDTFTRTTKAKLEELAKTGFQNESFIIFSSDVRKKDGRTITFSSPAPAFIVPAPKTRYDSLDKGTISFSANAVIDGVSIPLKFTVRKSSSFVSGDNYAVDVGMEVPSDVDGSYYEQIPIPRQATYIIDTVKKTVSSLKTNTAFRNSDSQRMEDMNFDYLPTNR